MNPLLTNNVKAESAQVETYSVERPEDATALSIYNEIITASTKYGVKTDLALRIARAESNFHQHDSNGNVLRGIVNSADVGIFQINEKYHLDRSEKLGFDIHNAHDNIGYAMWLLKNDGTSPWNWSKFKWSGTGYLKTNT